MPGALSPHFETRSLIARYPDSMSSDKPSSLRLQEAKALIREKGLSRQDLALLDDILRAGSGDLFPLLESSPTGGLTSKEMPNLAKLRRSFGLFLAFLNRFSDKNLGEIRPAMGLVLTHSLARLGHLAKAAHEELLLANEEPDWVAHLLGFSASLRTMSTSLGPDGQPQLREHWAAFLAERKDHFKELFAALSTAENGPSLVNRLNAQMKVLNRSLQGEGARPSEAVRKLAEILEGAVPESTRERIEPLLLVQHVISSLHMTLLRPLDRGFHWPAVEQVRGSLQWLWNHLGWTLPRVEDGLLEKSLPADVRRLLKQMKKDHPEAFLVVARALASHLALCSLVESMDPAANATVMDRYAAVPTFYVMEGELGRLAERVYHPRSADLLPKGSEEQLLLGAFLRQAVLSLLQDQSTIRGLLQQTLAQNDTDQLAQILDNLKALLLNHQRQLMGDLVGLFSAELRQRLFPDSPSLTEEGDRLRQRLHRLWEYVDPIINKLELNLELRDWPRLALALSQTQYQVASFRRSPEFLLIRTPDRHEFERISGAMFRALDEPENMERALQDATELTSEMLRFLEQFLLRINARVPLIRHDLTISREALSLSGDIETSPQEGSDRARLTHKMIQTTKRLGVRDPQALSLLKRWVRAERGGKESASALRALSAHLERLSMRLDAALN